MKQVSKALSLLLAILLLAGAALPAGRAAECAPFDECRVGREVLSLRTAIACAGRPRHRALGRAKFLPILPIRLAQAFAVLDPFECHAGSHPTAGVTGRAWTPGSGENARQLSEGSNFGTAGLLARAVRSGKIVDSLRVAGRR